MATQQISRRVTAGAFTRDAVADLSRRKQEPEWLREWRLAAWEQAERLPFPSSYERAWKYLNPDRIRIDGLTLSSPPPAATTAAKMRTAASAGRVSTHNGGVVEERLSDALRAQGVILCSLDTAVREHPELVRRHLGTVAAADEGVFVALNAAFWDGGAFLYVPKDVQVGAPLHLVTSLSGTDTALFPRLLVVAERGARVSFFDQHTGGDGPAFVSSVTEMVLADESRVHAHGLQTWGSEVQEIYVQRAEVGRNAEVLTVNIGLGGSIYKGWVESNIRGAGARSDIYGAVYGTGGQHFDVITTQEHIGEHTVSDLLIKAALTDRALSAYYGMTRINKSARMSDANQEDRNLLLSDHAKAEAEPVLEILTSEVARCAHGASVGPVDPEQLFYLECRGLPRDQAERLLVQGFLGDVLRRVKDEGVRATMEQAILAKLGA